MSLVLPRIVAKHKCLEGGTTDGVINWGPPDSNWNPWINQPVLIEGAEEYQVISFVLGAVLQWLLSLLLFVMPVVSSTVNNVVAKEV